jgi:hypothetical protein
MEIPRIRPHTIYREISAESLIIQYPDIAQMKTRKGISPRDYSGGKS